MSAAELSTAIAEAIDAYLARVFRELARQYDPDPHGWQAMRATTAHVDELWRQAKERAA